MSDVAPTQVGPFAECPLCRHWIHLDEFAPAEEGGFVATCAYCDDEVWLPPTERESDV